MKEINRYDKDAIKLEHGDEYVVLDGHIWKVNELRHIIVQHLYEHSYLKEMHKKEK